MTTSQLLVRASFPSSPGTAHQAVARPHVASTHLPHLDLCVRTSAPRAPLTLCLRSLAACTPRQLAGRSWRGSYAGSAASGNCRCCSSLSFVDKQHIARVLAVHSEREDAPAAECCLRERRRFSSRQSAACPSRCSIFSVTIFLRVTSQGSTRSRLPGCLLSDIVDFL